MSKDQKIFKKIFDHIFRWWDEDDYIPHPLLKVVPPFLLELVGVGIVLLIAYGIGKYLFEQISNL
ncbi:MAG: hypothetical protein ROO71_09995 [Balneola sp.]